MHIESRQLEHGRKDREDPNRVRAFALAHRPGSPRTNWRSAATMNGHWSTNGAAGLGK